MSVAIADAEVEGCDELIPSLAAFGTDAHVVAAAIVGRADVIVTMNLVDFPSTPLQSYNLIAQAPDDFLLAQWGLRPDVILTTIRTQAAALKNPPMSAADILQRLCPIAPRFSRVVATAIDDHMPGHRN